jgi:hypothetical protein
MLKPSKRGWFFAFVIWAIGMIAQSVLAGWHAWRDEQLATAIHWLHERYGAGWLAVYAAWAADNPVKAVAIGTCLIVVCLNVVTFAHDRFLAKRERDDIPNRPDETDISLQVTVNDDYQDDRKVFSFENYGNDPAFSASGKVALNGTDYLDFKAEREVLKGRPEPTFVYLVSGGKRELVRGYELAGILHEADMAIAQELHDGERYVFAATRTSEIDFLVSISFVDRNRALHGPTQSHRLIFRRRETRAAEACRFEPIPTNGLHH